MLIVSLGFAVPLVLLSFALWWFGTGELHIGLAHMQTMIFLWLVTSGQATIYLVREREHFWHSRPSRWLAVSSGVDVMVVMLLAWRGVMMTSIGLVPLSVVLGTSVVYLFLVDSLKGWIFRFAGLPR